MASALSLFEALPGLDAPLDGLGKSFARMWRATADRGQAAPATEDAKATQVNLVLHLGDATTAEDGVEQFQTAVRFSHRYPCRVVVLCPEGAGGETIKAKIYGECSIGKSKADARCCEFVLLSYTPSASPFLEDQVSVCLSTDLPLYYWAHGFHCGGGRLDDCRYLLENAKRILIDSADCPADALAGAWPRPEVVRDLAYARTLPVRQSLGQFLSRYPMDSLCGGLEAVTVTHGKKTAAESQVLLAWLRDRISHCGRNRAAFEDKRVDGNPPLYCRVDFRYAGGKKRFAWEADFGPGRARFEADFGAGKTSLPAATGLMAPENALSEAMFFE